MSVEGQDVPGLGVLFKRENPDVIIVVGEDDVVMLPMVVGTWRDVPFGAGRDYDDSLVEQRLVRVGEDDTTGPLLQGAKARDSESILLSFDEKVVAVDVSSVQVVDDAGQEIRVVDVSTGVLLPTEILVRVAPMGLQDRYEVRLANVVDAHQNTRDEVNGSFTSPSTFVPFSPVVDEEPPILLSALAPSPASIEIRFSERLAEDTVDLAAFVFSHRTQPDAPALLGVRLKDGGSTVLLTTEVQTQQGAYHLTISGLEDLAGNRIEDLSLDVNGFGEFDPPQIDWAYAISPTRVVVK